MIRVTNDSVYLIELFGQIGQSLFADGWTLERFKKELDNVQGSQVQVDIKSAGGDVFEAFAIYDALRAIKARVTVRIVGASASAATIIAAAGDRVLISENSRYLVHEAQTFVQGNKRQLSDSLELLESIDNQILDIYVKRTGKDRAVLAELMQKEKYMTAQEALEWGFVDEIIKQEVTNMKVQNMTEEEAAALTQENEQLKKQLEDLTAKLDELQAEKAKAEEEQIEKEIEAHIEAGKITAEVKGFWVNAYKSDSEQAQKAIEAIKVVALADVPAQGKPQSKNKAELWNEFKAGRITAAKYAELTK
jgi:ATP-dependent Clp protease protease subunit